jgi:hypothetical protein
MNRRRPRLDPRPVRLDYVTYCIVPMTQELNTPMSRKASFARLSHCGVRHY